MEPKYIDVHSHVQFKAYDEDREEVISRTLGEGVHMMNVGTDRAMSQAAVALAEAHEGMYAAIALHPTSTSGQYEEPFDPAFYAELAKHPKVKAIGECGLDYYRLDENTAARQKEVFIQHIKIANEADKPLMLHIRSGSGRSAYLDAVEILKAHALVKGDVHFFAGTWEEAQLFLEIGFTLSFTGVITFTHDYDEVVRTVPLDMIMSETDCPYITPTPFRGRRNEPMHVREVVKAIARIKELDEDVVRKAIVANARRVFGIE